MSIELTTFVLGVDEYDDPAVKVDDANLLITCGRCQIDIARCNCPKDWLNNRALWIAAERRVELAQAQAEEFTKAALRDFEKLNATITTLQTALGLALEQWGAAVRGLVKLDLPAERDAHRTEIARLNGVLTNTRLDQRDRQDHKDRQDQQARKAKKDSNS